MTVKLTMACLLAALFIGSGSTMAQEDRRDYSEQRLKLRAEMMALDMAERYGLDENQVKKLTEANLVWLQKRGEALKLHDGSRYDYRDRRRADRRHHRRGGCCDGPRYEDYCCETYCEEGYHAPDCRYQEDVRPSLEERRNASKAYQESLREIMTEEQYKAYLERWTGRRP